jgi:hypothetical protein
MTAASTKIANPVGARLVAIAASPSTTARLTGRTDGIRSPAATTSTRSGR